MESRRKFLVVLLAGIGFVVLGFVILTIENAALASQFLRHPNEIVPGCNPGTSYGCVTWPFTDLALVVLGLIMTVVGLIGVVETFLPRPEV